MNPLPSSSSAFLTRLHTLVPGTLVSVVQGESLVLTSPSNLRPLLIVLQQHTGREFSQLRDITAIDSPERRARFEVVYSLLSLSSATRVSVSVRVSEGTSIPSVVDLYPSAG